eukprot:GHVO01023267.1.p1 GENE.GHVO01023267.1~~GHVO01023267.1.p1  ORF type:complete len:187 (+),score=54.39 GHVO01023267.1:344-904(+)
MNPDDVFDHTENVDRNVFDKLVEYVRSRLTSSALKFRATIDVRCLGYEGVDAVKDALRCGALAAEAMAETCGETQKKTDGKPATDLKIKLIAPPKYVVVATEFQKEDGMKIVEACLAAIEKCITGYDQGEYKVTEEISVFGGEEDLALEEMLKLHAQEEEEDSDEEDIEGMGVADGVPFGDDDDED